MKDRQQTESESVTVMKFGHSARAAGQFAKKIAAGMIAASMVAMPGMALAQAAAAASPAASPTPAGSYTPMVPTPGIGMPVDGGWTFQEQFSPTGHFALWMHDWVLLPVITQGQPGAVQDCAQHAA
jgi:cytochrome c oxidase subunit 2